MAYVQALQQNMIDGRKVFFFGTLVAFVASFLLYVYFLNTTIVQVVERKNAESNISETTMRISELESEYLRLSSSITPTLAQTLGFVEPKGVTFASRDIHSGFAGLRE